MGIADAFAPAMALQKAELMFATWGHLYPKGKSKQFGYVIFAVSGYSATDGQPLEIEFKGLGDSPMLYQHVSDMTLGMACDSGNFGPRMKPGIYRWSGEYRVLRNGEARFQKGKLHLLVPLDGKGGHVGVEVQIPLNHEQWRDQQALRQKWGQT